MAHKKYKVISNFENYKIGDSVIVGDNQIEYFVEKGWIEIKGKKKKTKTKQKEKTEVKEVKIEN